MEITPSGIWNFIQAIIPALIIVGVGYRIQVVLVKRANECALIDLIFEYLKNNEATTLDYWTAKCNNSDDQTERLKKEQQIKGILRTISTLLEIHYNQYLPTKEKKRKVFSSDIHHLINQLFYTTTDDFESPKSERATKDNERKLSSVYLRVTNSSNEIREILSQRKT